jgi:hypothetical protein
MLSVEKVRQMIEFLRWLWWKLIGEIDGEYTPDCTLAKITHRRRFHYRCIGAKSPWVPERRFGTLARRQEGEEQSG